MPDPIALQLRGRPEWRAAIEQVRIAAGVDTLADLIDLAVRPLAKKHGVTLPTRVHPRGTNRYGRPGEAKAGKAVRKGR